jgi:hypothetical protein
VEVELQVERAQQRQVMVVAVLGHLAQVLIQVQESKLALAGHHLSTAAVEMVTTPLVPQELQDQVQALSEQRH